MYDIRQFRPALYTLLILGMTAFALASQSPGLWVLAVAAILLNAWLIKVDLFRPMPRFVANLVTIGALLYVAVFVRQAVTTPILIVGQFLVFLQIVKLYEQRANRDYAQLIVLSLLLVVAAAISTASLAFGLLLISYLFLSLYVCLLFHLKVETDYAKQAIGISEEDVNPTTLRQDQRYLSASMRRLTAFVSVVSVTMAVLVFIFFPRGSSGSLLGPMSFRPGQTLTGFSDQPLSFQQVARITQNPQIVAYVSLWKDGQPVRGTMPLWLRGKTMSVYSGDDDSAGGRWQWGRPGGSHQQHDLRPGNPTTFPRRGAQLARQTALLGVPLLQQQAPTDDVAGEGAFRQRITLEPTGTPVLFALPGVLQLTPAPPLDGRVIFSPDDSTIQVSEPLLQRVSYEALSDDRLPDNGPMVLPARRIERWTLAGRSEATVPLRSVIHPRIEQLARDPDVSGRDDEGELAERRDRAQRVTELDLPIAASIERYLRTNFLYTLDLTDASRAAGEDPMVAFLYDFRRGHCEYFAGAMALMCQSLGLQARVVIGFRSDEYNDIGGYYIVRQAHAHAWVEVLGDDGYWHTFDPTTGREATATTAGLLGRLRNLFNFLEFTWANSVVAYDRESRSNVIHAAENTLVQTAAVSITSMRQAKNWLTGVDPSDRFYLFSSRVLSGMIYLMIAALIAAVLWFFVEKWRLRRRARRIGLDALPRPDQLRLARQLGFYDELLRLLERHRIVRPRHLTPMEFSQSISFLPVEAFDTIRRLTDVFYRVRFGGAELSGRQRGRLHKVLGELEQSLAGALRGTAARRLDPDT